MREKFILLGMVVLLMFGIAGCGKIVNVSGQHLTDWKMSRGGGMTGGHSAVEVTEINGEVYLIYYNADTWADDESVAEYLVDRAILDDMEAVFRKNGMNRWHQKKFTNIFVADGESESYSFEFDNGGYVSFSSQIYPYNYGKKLGEFDAVIKKYKGTATLLPNLVMEETNSEEKLYRQNPDNGTVEMEVYEYYKGRLCYRILNGTGEDVILSGPVKLVCLDDDAVKYSVEDDNESNVYANSVKEDEIRMDERLGTGKYVLNVGGYETTFEIK